MGHIKGAFGGPNPNAWHNWYHTVGSTYGTWIRGDPRGFRTYRHRMHVDGDYRNPPPPGVYAPLFEHVKRSLRYPPVKLDPAQRRHLCRALVRQLLDDGVQVIALAVCVNHFHMLIRCPQLDEATRRRYEQSLLRDGRDPAPRHYVGLARKAASESLHAAGLKPASPVWALRPKMEPIRDRGHQVNTGLYIQGHVEQGAAVYCIKGFLF